MKNLSEAKAMATIEAMVMSAPHRNALADQWRSGDPSARFIVFNAWRRQVAR